MKSRQGRELYLPDPISDWLDLLARKKGVSRSRVVQDLITAEWKRHLRRMDKEKGR